MNRLGAPLTAHEERMVKLYCMGWTAEDIAAELGIAEATAHSYIRDIKRKWVGAGMTRREFYERAQEEGIMP